MLAKDIMTRDVVTVRPSSGVRELAKLLATRRISGAPVVSGRGKVVGMVSEADILAKKGKEVKAIMNRRLVTVREDTPVEEIAALMTAHKIKRVPVLRGKKLVGIVSRWDIIRALAMGKHIALHTPIYDL